MLEFGGNESARSFWGMVPSDTGLCIVFELFKGCAHALAVRFSHPIISADEGRQRNGLRSGKRSVPSGPMLHRLNGFSVGILVLVRRSLSNKLFARFRVLSLTELSKILRRNCSAKAELCSKLPLPLASDHTALRPIVLLLGREFLLVIGLCLARRQGL